MNISHMICLPRNPLISGTKVIPVPDLDSNFRAAARVLLGVNLTASLGDCGAALART